MLFNELFSCQTFSSVYILKSFILYLCLHSEVLLKKIKINKLKTFPVLFDTRIIILRKIPTKITHKIFVYTI